MANHVDAASSCQPMGNCTRPGSPGGGRQADGKAQPPPRCGAWGRPGASKGPPPSCRAALPGAQPCPGKTFQVPAPMGVSRLSHPPLPDQRTSRASPLQPSSCSSLRPPGPPCVPRLTPSASSSLLSPRLAPAPPLISSRSPPASVPLPPSFARKPVQAAVTTAPRPAARAPYPGAAGLRRPGGRRTAGKCPRPRAETWRAAESAHPSQTAQGSRPSWRPARPAPPRPAPELMSREAGPGGRGSSGPSRQRLGAARHRRKGAGSGGRGRPRAPPTAGRGGSCGSRGRKRPEGAPSGESPAEVAALGLGSGAVGARVGVARVQLCARTLGPAPGGRA